MSTDDQHVPLPGSERKAPTQAMKLGATEPHKRMSVSVYLRRGNAQQFDHVLEGHTRGTGLQAQGPLTKKEFAERFSADPKDIALVEKFAAACGLQVEARDPARRLVVLGGTAEKMAAAFRVTLEQYEVNGSVFRAREGFIFVPLELQQVVVGVFGLDARPQARAHFRLGRKRPGGKGVEAAAPASRSYNPTEVARIYRFPTNLTGAGETIGIVELGGGYKEADLQTYFASLGVAQPPSVQGVSVDGGANQPSGDPNSADGEVALDIEVAGAVAPGARQKVFFAPNTDQGFQDAISQAIHDSDVTLVSISWGQAEAGYTAQALTAFNQTLQDAVTLGKTVFVAAGDNGSSDGETDGKNHVDFPASSPYVVACGGTTLEADPATGAINSEVVWNESAANEGATGGGVSDVFSRPDYQGNAHVPLPQGSGGGRGVPDVAAVADPVTGFNVLIDGQTVVTGGTSAVAPLYAGLFALVNEGLRAAKKGRAGFVHPVLYANPEVFRDITQGNNGAFTAGPGWDAATGLGSPLGDQILAALKAQPVAGSDLPV